MMRRKHAGPWLAALCCAVGAATTAVAATPARKPLPKDPLEPARAALRTLQFDRAIALLGAAGDAGNADAQYLLGLMYVNGVGIAPDAARGRALLQTAAEHGQGAAAYVLAGELAHAAGAPPDAARQWLERSAKLGYYRAVDALRSARPLLDRESVGASDPALLAPWVIDCARRNDAAELRRLGPISASVRDEFGRGSLSHAAAADALDAAAVLLEFGAAVNAADRAGTTALMIAAEKPTAAMADLLLQHGADSRAVDAEQRTALFYAARANRTALIGALQHGGVVLEARDSRGYNALDAALSVGAEAAAAELRALGVHANRTGTEVVRQSGKFDAAHPGEIYRNWPPLALAVARNDTAAVQQLLGAGGDANLRLPQGDTLLQVAADAHALQSLPLLLARGADASAADHAGHGVMWLATVRGDLALVHALLDAGVRPDSHTPGEPTPLLAALRARHAEVAQLLLSAGADPDAADAQGRTPLMLSCSAGELGLAKLLLEHHAKIDAEDRQRRSALWFAAARGSGETVALLLAAGANRDATDSAGLTVLHAAVAQPATGVLAVLLTTPAHLNQRDGAGNTPLLLAAAKGHADIVQALLAHTPQLDVQNDAGDTALIAAGRGGYAGICRMLLKAGANRALRNAAGVSAADVAAGRGFAAVAKELGGKG